MSRENEQHEKTCSVLHNERKSEKNTAFSLSIAVFDSIGDHLCEKKVACKSKCGIFGCLFEFKNFSFHCSLQRITFSSNQNDFKRKIYKIIGQKMNVFRFSKSIIRVLFIFVNKNSWQTINRRFNCSISLETTI